MSTYELPREPDVERVWVNFPEGWFVARRIAHNSWSTGEGTRYGEHTWAELLDLGGVTDQHPDLSDLKFPFMFGRDISGHHVFDADERALFSVGDEGMARFLVEAANAYAERLTNGGA